MSKLDRLVAERVFGWTVVAASDGEPIWSNDCSTPLAFQYASAPVKFGPNFSTEISAAWEVVKHMRSIGFGLDHIVWADRMACSETEWGKTEENACMVSFGREKYDAVNNRHTHAEGESHTPEKAICLAALRAVGVPEATIQEACK
jgi:hypothetical protein